MTKSTNKYTSVFYILVFGYLNFYFLSPFIHDHPVVINGQLETKNTLHSHIDSALELHSHDSNSAEAVCDSETSHTHNYAFDTPIINQNIEKLKHTNTSYFSHQKVECFAELGIKIELLGSLNFSNQVLWEKYVHFGSNSSPPSIYHTFIS